MSLWGKQCIDALKTMNASEKKREKDKQGGHSELDDFIGDGMGNDPSPPLPKIILIFLTKPSSWIRGQVT